MSRALEAFIRGSTKITPVRLVPEIRLHLATDSQRIFQRAEELERPGERFPPFWAFAWPGGQALARYILDTPAIVAGRHVIDIGAGSGIAAIAAMQAGAASALAADVDPLAALAIRRNAAANGVAVETTTVLLSPFEVRTDKDTGYVASNTLAGSRLNTKLADTPAAISVLTRNGVAVETTTHDILGEPVDAGLVVIADLVYEPALAMRVAAFLESAAASGTDVLLADRTTARRPPLSFSLIAEYDAPLTPDMHDLNLEKARLWRLDQRRGRRMQAR